MKASKPDSLNNDNEGWPAAPVQHKTVSLRSRTLNVARQIKLICSIFNNHNLGKAITYIEQRNFVNLWRSFRNTLSLRISIKPIDPHNIDIISTGKLNTNQPLVSVVIPCFNYGDYIEDAIKSILAQTLQDVEIIVIDGGSTDNSTRKKLKQLNYPKTQIVLREGRHLVGDNRNYGINIARGRYICCLDADDTLSPTYLEKAVFLLETYGYDCISTAINFIGERKGQIGIIEQPNLRSMEQGNHIHTCAVYRRFFWEHVGGFYDTGLGAEHVAEDWDFWLRIAATGARLRNIAGEALFNYRIHKNGSLSSTNVRSIAKQRKSIIKRNRHLLNRKTRRLSDLQNSRIIKNTHSGGVLLKAKELCNCEKWPCLVIALPFMLIGGAERLLSTVVEKLSSFGWRIIIVTTVYQHPDEGDSTHWFSKNITEIYRLPAFLNPIEWDDFIEYIFSSRKPDCLLIVGSIKMYENTPFLRERFPEMAIVDLLFNTVGHIDSHRKFIQYLDAVIAENTDVENWLKSVGWGEKKIARIQSGIDITQYAPIPSCLSWREQLGINRHALVVGYSGRLSTEKAPEVVLEIAQLCKENKEIHFVMTGSGPLNTQVSAAISKLPDCHIHFLGAIDDIKFIIGQYDILLLTSRIDGRPQVVLEALSMGVPVIASNLGGLPSLIKEDETGYLCPVADARSFSERIQYLANDRHKLNLMKQAARAFAEDSLGVDNMINGYRDTLLHAIQSRRSH